MELQNERDQVIGIVDIIDGEINLFDLDEYQKIQEDINIIKDQQIFLK